MGATPTDAVPNNGYSSTARKTMLVDPTTGLAYTTAKPLPTSATITGDVNVDATSIDINAYIGKPVGGNGDFITTYNAATKITLSALPTEITNINQQDIELIRQIDNTGNVVNSYSRDDVKLSVTLNVVTVTAVPAATFAATDTFIVYTNLARPIEITGDVNVEATSINVNAYIGKPSGTNGDFVTARTGLTTFTCATLPSGVTSIKAGDIELIRSTNTVGTVTHSYSRDDVRITCSGTDPTTVTVTGADFATTDTIVVYTNIYRPFVNAITVVEKTTSQLLSAAILSYTSNFAAKMRIKSILIHFSGAVSQTVTLKLDSGAGSNYDTILEIDSFIAKSDYDWEPDSELILGATDEILVTCTNAGTPAITAYLTIVGESI